MSAGGDSMIDTVRAVHLDAVGGVAGDMFAAALLDALPELEPAVTEAVAAMALPGVSVARLAHDDGRMTGSRFCVTGAGSVAHGHAHWATIRGRIEAAPLAGAVRANALGIFALLAEAEAAVHGVAADDVVFHEVGAADSIADILAAAALIAALPACRWSIGPLPRGSGLVETAHGALPVPAPATLRLLRGFTLFDDGEAGERITPTGAAILAWLKPDQGADPAPRRVLGAGTGFGTRRLAGRPNVLRASLYGEAATTVRQPVDVLRFEIDDQTGEDLAAALDHLRATEGVLDVCQWPVTGKKGRIAFAVQVLIRPERRAAVCAAVFAETATLGIRAASTERITLERWSAATVQGRAKLARRPSGLAAKAEMDDLAALPGRSAREDRRRQVEAAALADAATATGRPAVPTARSEESSDG